MSKANIQFAKESIQSGEAASIPSLLAQAWGYHPVASRSKAVISHNFIKDDKSLQFYFEAGKEKWNGIAIQINKKGRGRISGLIKPISWEDAISKLLPYI